MTTPTPEERLPNISTLVRECQRLAAENATLREHIREARACSQRNGVAWNILGTALAQQPKETTVEDLGKAGDANESTLTERRHSETTDNGRQGGRGVVSPTEPYRPKVGERARLEASPDPEDRDDGEGYCKLGRVWVIVGIEAASGRLAHLPEYYWKARDEDGCATFIHRDATWSRVEAVAAPLGGVRQCGGYAVKLGRDGDSRPIWVCAHCGLPRPVASDPAAAEKPTGEPSDGDLRAVGYAAGCIAVGREGRTTEAFTSASNRAIYEAGRASEAAARAIAEQREQEALEREDVSARNSERFQRRWVSEQEAHGTTKAELEQALGELAEAVQQLRDSAEAMAAARTELAELRALYNANAMKAELERVRGELATERECRLANEAELRRADALLGEAKKDLAALREGRPEPTDGEVAEAMRASLHGSLAVGMIDGNLGLHLARAAKSLLLGVRPRGVVGREALYSAIEAAHARWRDDDSDDRPLFKMATDAAADAVISALGARVVPRCQCTHEPGDSQCPAHPTCSECGEDATAPGYLCSAHVAAPDVGEKDSRPTGQKEGSDGERRRSDDVGPSGRVTDSGAAVGPGSTDGPHAEQAAPVADDRAAAASSLTEPKPSGGDPGVGQGSTDPLASRGLGTHRGHSTEPNEPPCATKPLEERVAKLESKVAELDRRWAAR